MIPRNLAMLSALLTLLLGNCAMPARAKAAAGLSADEKTLVEYGDSHKEQAVTLLQKLAQVDSATEHLHRRTPGSPDHRRSDRRRGTTGRAHRHQPPRPPRSRAAQRSRPLL